MPDDIKREKLVNVIESAMSRLEGRSPDSVVADDEKEQEKLELGRRTYDQALAKRLAQIRNAMGKDAPAMPLAPLPAAAPGPALQRRGFQTGTLFATALLSAVAGAGAMWLTIASTPPRAAQVATEPIQSAPPAPIAVPARSEVVETASVAPAPTPTDDDQVRNLIDNWRSAWADRDVEGYLACYSADFSPANGQNHDAWAAARRKSISTRSDITVNTNELKLERLDAQRMKAQFLQDYASGSYRETAQPKTLLLVRHETGWKIVGEWQGEAPAGAIGKP